MLYELPPLPLPHSSNKQTNFVLNFQMISSRTAAGSAALWKQLGPRLFSASAVTGHLPVQGLFHLSSWMQTSSVRFASAEVERNRDKEGESTEDAGAVTAGQAKAVAPSYWGISPSKIVKEDGTEWRWACFRPWHTYKADTSIDLKKHHAPKTFVDKLAYGTVKALRVPSDLFFQRRHGCHAVLLETVAGVPGMVGGMLLHLRSLRRFEHTGGWVRALLEEAENERMHLMTFMEVTNPKWYERALVIAVQGVFFNLYFLGYLISPKFAHRVTGYLEEEAVHSYTAFLTDLEKGEFENAPAPAIAIDYWRLPPDATLLDVVRVIRADEAHHRDVNHYASDIHHQGKQLKEFPAPLEYH